MRVLDPTPTDGAALRRAAELDPAELREVVKASGLRGRGGAGFPTGVKWDTVAAYASPTRPTTVVVNAAEGEPGTFKDRAILRANAPRVVEGALIAARAVGAEKVVFALKGTFEPEIAAVRKAIDALEGDVPMISVATGPSEYLFGEETALLEVLDGRGPFPRLNPPFRHGVDEVGETGGESSGDVVMAAEGGTEAAPTLVENVETLANVPGIVVHGADWFRELGTADSPGTIVATVTGDTERHGVVEVPMGTPLRDVIDHFGGPRPKRTIKAVVSGVANPFLPASLLDTPLTYEDMEAAGAGLGSAGFIVLDDTRDMVAVAHGIERFLAIESCGQCRPCKGDGLAMRDLLDEVRRSAGPDDAQAQLADRVSTVATGARCYLATQQERVVGSLLEHFADELDAHTRGDAPEAEPYLVAPLVDIVDDVAVLEVGHEGKQPDWTFDVTDSGQTPAERIDQRARA